MNQFELTPRQTQHEAIRKRLDSARHFQERQRLLKQLWKLEQAVARERQKTELQMARVEEVSSV